MVDDAGTTFLERLHRFGAVTNPLNCLASSEELDAAEAICNDVAQQPLSVSERARAKTLYDSAYHPDTGELIPLVGRICFQAPGCAVIAAAMLAMHRSLPATLGLQVLNQSFMATCNYSNRNAAAGADVEAAPPSDVVRPYLAATFGSVFTAWGLKRCLPKTWSVLVPAASISVASMINVPCMRSAELRDGLVVEDARGEPLDARCREAAYYGVATVTAARILNGCADLVVAPALVGLAASRGFQVPSRPLLAVPLYTSLCFATLAVSTPLTCSLVPQRSTLPAARLGADVQAELARRKAPPSVYFNKGL